MLNCAKSKKGMSNVVAVVLLVLIAVVAVTTITAFTKKISLSPEDEINKHFSCVDAQFNLPVNIQLACFNKTSNNLEVTVKRDLGTDLSSFNLIFSKGKESYSYSCGYGCGTCTLLEKGTEKKYYLFSSSEDKPEKVSLRIGSCLVVEREVNYCN